MGDKDGLYASLGFPFHKDFRDPNLAWTVEAKCLFVVVYSCWWVFIVSAVYKWDMIREIVSAKFTARRSTANMDQEEELNLIESPSQNVNVGPKPNYPRDMRIHEIFFEQAEQTPNAIALVIPRDSDKSLQPRSEMTYDVLMKTIVRLVHALRQEGLRPGRIAALSLERCVAQVVSIYAVLATGSGYLPIDSDATISRKRIVLLDSEAKVMIAEKADDGSANLAADLELAFFALHPDTGVLICDPGTSIAALPTNGKHGDRPESSDLAMLIYTSGTTGTPKGIIYDHTHLLHGAHFWAEEHSITSESTTLLKSPYFWAVIEWEVFPALIRGGSLVVASRDGHKSPEYLARIVKEEKITVLMITPSVLDLVLDIHDIQRDSLTPLQHITCVGEPLPTALANRTVAMRNMSATLRNFYGASESCCTVYLVPKGGVDVKLFPNKAPAGLPQAHAVVYIMATDEMPFREVAHGESGEICFGGVLAAGYFKLGELTKSKFVDSEVYGRVYRTGDLGRFRGGVLEVIGRTDRQVKVRGVRIEPEEIEAVLKRFGQPRGADAADLEKCGDWHDGTKVRRAAVVATAEPVELVAFVSLSHPDNGVGVEELRSHCQANLAPAYIPKHFVLLQNDWPVLPNGKTDMTRLRARASTYINEIEEVVVDSLGQMRSMSRQALLENAVIHRCYSFWMLGVLIDHYARCAMDVDPSDPSGETLLPFCTAMASINVKPWSEVLIRAFGNDQDLFGFILIGAYQDSRMDKPSEPSRVKLGLKDLFVFAVYLFACFPLPQICNMLTGGWAWPDRTYASYAWDYVPPTDMWGWGYMQKHGSTSGHRWYLLMVLEARVFMRICQGCSMPPWGQALLVSLPTVLGAGSFSYSGDVCASENAPEVVKFVFMWLFGPNAGSCAAWVRWVHSYVMVYVLSFYYLRPFVKRCGSRLPKGPAWAAAATGVSMLLGVLMALFHYPNVILETGADARWAVLELTVSLAQPLLLALGTTYWPGDAAWWGQSTLGCYVFHFILRDRMSEAIMWLAQAQTWDPSGLVYPVSIVLICLLIMSTLGPLCQQLLISPRLFAQRLAKRAAGTQKGNTAKPYLFGRKTFRRSPSPIRFDLSEMVGFQRMSADL